MEHVIDDIMSRSFSVKSSDPYTASHDILHWCQQFGRVEENRNRVLSSGPRTTSEVDFILKKHLDKFSMIVFKVKLNGHVKLERLDIRIDASFRADLPAPTGLMTQAFEEYYQQRIFPVLFENAKDMAESIVETFEKRAAAVQLKRAYIEQKE